VSVPYFEYSARVLNLAINHDCLHDQTIHSSLFLHKTAPLTEAHTALYTTPSISTLVLARTVPVIQSLLPPHYHPHHSDLQHQQPQLQQQIGSDGVTYEYSVEKLSLNECVISNNLLCSYFDDLDIFLFCDEYFRADACRLLSRSVAASPLCLRLQ
jgi:hypothetical protein